MVVWGGQRFDLSEVIFVDAKGVVEESERILNFIAEFYKAISLRPQSY